MLFIPWSPSYYGWFIAACLLWPSHWCLPSAYFAYMFRPVILDSRLRSACSGLSVGSCSNPGLNCDFLFSPLFIFKSDTSKSYFSCPQAPVNYVFGTFVFCLNFNTTVKQHVLSATLQLTGLGVWTLICSFFATLKLTGFQ